MFNQIEFDNVATDSEAMSEFACNIGGEDGFKDRQWILTSYDAWVRNPHYQGPAQRHPEDWGYDDEENDAPYVAPSMNAAPVANWPENNEDIPF